MIGQILFIETIRKELNNGSEFYDPDGNLLEDEEEILDTMNKRKSVNIIPKGLNIKRK